LVYRVAQVLEKKTAMALTYTSHSESVASQQWGQETLTTKLSVAHQQALHLLHLLHQQKHQPHLLLEQDLILEKN
jgi:hypothetical protein